MKEETMKAMKAVKKAGLMQVYRLASWCMRTDNELCNRTKNSIVKRFFERDAEMCEKVNASLMAAAEKL